MAEFNRGEDDGKGGGEVVEGGCYKLVGESGVRLGEGDEGGG